MKARQALAILGVCLFLFCAFYVGMVLSTPAHLTETDISNLTDKWIDAVTVSHSPERIYSMFCHDGNLVGTVSQIERKGLDIQYYFDYFARLPGIKVVSKTYDISKVTPDVFINTAFITWKWDGLEKPITARMTFLFRNSCIFQLHSSKLPLMNEGLVNASAKA